MRSFLNSWDMVLDPTGDVEYLDLTNDFAARVVGVELTHVLSLGRGHSLQWGAEYRHKRFQWFDEGHNYTQNIYSAFLADDWRLGEKVFATLGARYDEHPLVGGHLAPRGGLVYRPGEGQTFRASYGTAYRDPSYMESYWSTEVHAVPGFTQYVHGNLDLESEEIRSYELGYQGMVAEDVLASLTLFRNEVSNLVDYGVVDVYPSPPAPIPGIPREISFLNGDGWRLYGAEFSLE
ncbi:MAG TPA: TonB-dependent receptor, partial [Spirochaetales bacterium]|nr:TonB-dependent receptor [Spirochaetales bacterium]